jgi:hypothetical protein
MGSLVKLSIGTVMAFALTSVACSSTSNNTTSDGGSSDAAHSETGTTDSSSDTGTTGETGGACTLAESTGTAECDTCAASACCDTWNKCFGDTTCKTLADCALNCVTNAGDGGAGDAGDGGDAGDPVDNCKKACANAPGVTQAVIDTLNGALDCIVAQCAGGDAGTLADGGAPPCQ